MTSALRRRNALCLLFLLPGLGISSWVTRTPDVRDQLGASTAQMGFILFGLSVGSMVGILGSGPLVARWGTRRVIGIGMLANVAGVAVVGLGAALGSGVLVAAGLAIFGLGMGGGEVALNIDGAEVERLFGRSVMPVMHGFFSLGTVIGAGVGMVLTATRFPVIAHLMIASVLMVAGLAVALRGIPVGFGRRSVPGSVRHAGDADGLPRPAVWRDRRLLLLGCVILALAMAEGTANDWLPLVMVDGHGFDAAWGSGVFAVFAASMTLGRFTGGRFVNRYGQTAVLIASALVGSVGIAGVVFFDHGGVAAGAVVLWGLGASLGFPVALSAVGAGVSDPEQAAARVSFAATIGYIAFLVGPPVLGVLGENLGLRQALILVMVLVALAALLAALTRTPRTATQAGTAAPAPADVEPQVRERSGR